MQRVFAVGAAVFGLLACAPVAAGADDPLRGRQWGLDQIRADAARATSTGEGAVVAVIDSGVQADHPDLTGRLLGGRDFVDDDDTPQDGDGHGTHVTGIIAAATGNGVGVGSVAPGAKVLPVRVLGNDGGGNEADIVEGVDYAIAQGADVINLSLGFDVPVTAVGLGGSFDAAIDRALDRGIVVVAAAGNNGLPVCEQPSGRDRLLCVGAVDKREMRSFFSSFGQGLGLVAPGGSGLPAANEDVLSTIPPSGYEELAGTSQAAPHVAGVAALLVSLGVRGQDAARRIIDTARDVGSPGRDAQFGAGIVNAAAAVAGLTRPGGGGAGAGGGDGAGSGSGGSVGSGGGGGAGSGEGGGAGGTGGGSTSGSGGGTRARGSLSIARTQSLKSVLRRGIAVRCRAAAAGRCTAGAKRRGRTVARGSTKVQAGGKATVRARLTSAGRRMLVGAERTSVLVRATFPGGPVRKVRVVLER